MTDDFRIDVPFKTKPPRLKDLVNKHIMGDVWVRDTPFGPVTDSLKIAEKFEMDHKNILRAIKKCESELGTELKFELCRNLIENSCLGGPKGRETRRYLRVRLGIITTLYQHSQGQINISRNSLSIFYSQVISNQSE